MKDIDFHWKFVMDRPVRSMRRGIRWAHANPHGGMILKDQRSWRTINGVWINTSRWAAWFVFRRVM